MNRPRFVSEDHLIIECQLDIHGRRTLYGTPWDICGPCLQCFLQLTLDNRHWQLLVPEGRCDRSLARSAWDTATPKEPSRRVRCDRVGVRSDSMVGATKHGAH